MLVGFGDQLSEQIRRLARDTGVPPSQLLKRGVGLLSYLHEENDKGNQVVVTCKDSRAVKRVNLTS